MRLYICLVCVCWYISFTVDFFFSTELIISEFKRFPPKVGELEVKYLLDLQLFVLRKDNFIF